MSVHRPQRTVDLNCLDWSGRVSKLDMALDLKSNGWEIHPHCLPITDGGARSMMLNMVERSGAYFACLKNVQDIFGR
eukprot:1963826-Pyramimonas_sp.AAC.1